LPNLLTRSAQALEDFEKLTDFALSVKQGLAMSKFIEDATNGPDIDAG
jgi:hypothetical protein